MLKIQRLTISTFSLLNNSYGQKYHVKLLSLLHSSEIINTIPCFGALFLLQNQRKNNKVLFSSSNIFVFHWNFLCKKEKELYGVKIVRKKIYNNLLVLKSTFWKIYFTNARRLWYILTITSTTLCCRIRVLTLKTAFFINRDIILEK